MSASVPNVRSAVALRAAFSVLICWMFGTMAARSSNKVSHLMVALACIVSFATPMNLLGDTCRNAFIWASSIVVLTPLGLACCYLCFLLGGLQWNLWILAVGLGFTVLLGVVWSFAAAHLHTPRVMLAGNTATVVIIILPIALVLGGLKDHILLLQSIAGLVCGIFIGALVPLIISHLPYLGAEGARTHVPRAAAEKLTALADLAEAVAIYPLPTAAALHRHRECRLRILSSTLELNSACQSAKMELATCDLFAQDTSLENFRSLTEQCRRSLQMKSTMLAAGFSDVTLDLFFRGAQGERLRGTSVWAAHALRASGSYLLSLAGDKPPEVASAPWLGSNHAKAEDCEAAAERCRNAWKNFWDGQISAASHPRWREQVEESLLRSMPELVENPGVPLDLFLSGVHHKQANPDAARVLGFDEACRHCASVLGLRLGAEAASDIAELAASASQAWRFSLCSSGSFTGCRQWLRVPFYPSAWKAGWAKGGMFACRMASATLIAAVIFASVRPYLPKEEDGMWTLITVTMVVTPVAGASIFRGLLRLLGTFLGAALAVGSQALGGSWLSLAPQVFIMAFFNKYFEKELQYAGIVNVVTYLIILTTLADRNNPYLDDFVEILHLAARRMLDVMIGVLLSMFANIIFFPERAVDELRSRLLLSVQRTSAALRQSCEHLACLAQHQREEPTKNWEDLRSDVFASVEAMNFAGDGRAGVADLLSDAYLESSWWVDGGLVLGGVIWIPCGGNSLPGHLCLQAVLSMSRMLRITYMLACLCEPGFEEGADRPLAHDPMVLQALGQNGAAIGDEVDRAIEILRPHLEMQRCSRKSHHEGSEKLGDVLDRLEDRMELLFRGCAASRVKIGGLAMQPQYGEGATRSAAVLKLLHGAVQSFINVCRLLDGCTDDLEHKLKVTLSSDSETSASEDASLCP